MNKCMEDIKKIVKNRIKQYRIESFFPWFVTIILLLIIWFDNGLLNVKIMYAGEGNNGQIQLSYDGDNTDLGRVARNYAIIDSQKWVEDQGIVITSIKNEGSEAIRSITFRYWIVPVAYLNEGSVSKLISDNFVDDNGNIVERMKIKAGYLQSLGCVLSQLLFIRITFTIILFLLMFSYIFFGKKVSYEKMQIIEWHLILLTILMLVLVGCFWGIKNASPDESVSSASVIYYFKNWKFPDFRDPTLADTYSNYGNTRLHELTIYYFIAGKVGALFSLLFSNYISARVFNLFLFGILSFIVFRNLEEKKWLLVGITCTPQLWYLFTYATSDAWDYFLTFCLTIWLCAEAKEKVIDKRKERIQILLVGVAYGLLFLGKATYYFCFVYSFIILLIKLVKSPKNLRIHKLKKYVLILVVFIAIILIRNGIDSIVYGGDKASILSEMRDVYDRPETHVNTGLKERGVTIQEIFVNYKFAEWMYRSFWGMYGWMQFESGSIYYFVIISISTFLLLLLFAEKDHRIESIMTFGIIIASYIVVLIHAWSSDYQAQGRYLMPILPCVMLLGSRSRIINTKVFDYGLKTIAILGLYSFMRYGLSNIV